MSEYGVAWMDYTDRHTEAQKQTQTGRQTNTGRILKSMSSSGHNAIF